MSSYYLKHKICMWFRRSPEGTKELSGLYACLAFILVFTFFLVYFSTVFIRGSSSSSLERQGIRNDKIRRIIIAEVEITVREAILEVFRSIKTKIIDMFDKRYAAVIKVVAVAVTAVITTARSRRGDSMQYQVFNNTNPTTFDGVQDLIATIRWITNVEG